MSAWEIVAAVAIILVVCAVAAHFYGNPKFWRLANRHPDLALKLFAIEQGCLIDEPKPSGSEDYIGPFRLRATNGTFHKIYILEKDIDAIQARIAQTLYAAEGKAPHLGFH